MGTLIHDSIKLFRAVLFSVSRSVLLLLPSPPSLSGSRVSRLLEASPPPLLVPTPFDFGPERPLFCSGDLHPRTPTHLPLGVGPTNSPPLYRVSPPTWCAGPSGTKGAHPSSQDLSLQSLLFEPHPRGLTGLYCLRFVVQETTSPSLRSWGSSVNRSCVCIVNVVPSLPLRRSVVPCPCRSPSRVRKSR